jgi:hypothetical protein
LGASQKELLEFLLSGNFQQCTAKINVSQQSGKRPTSLQSIFGAFLFTYRQINEFIDKYLTVAENLTSFPGQRMRTKSWTLWQVSPMLVGCFNLMMAV